MLKSLILKDGYGVKLLKHKIDGGDFFDDFDFLIDELMFTPF